MGQFGESSFILIEEIGCGGFAIVYKAIMNSESIVAIKVFNSSKAFEKEAKIHHDLKHPNILRFIGTCSSKNYIITEYIPEGDLRTALRNNKFSNFEKINIIIGIAEGLVYLSEHNIVHRDIKTINILMKKGKPLIIDFGIAEFAGSNNCDYRPTQAYQCPEFQSIIDAEKYINHPSQDIYSFGFVIWEILFGEFGDRTNKDILKQFNPNNLFERFVKEILSKCWEENPQDRFSAKDIVCIANYLEQYLRRNNTANFQKIQKNSKCKIFNISQNRFSPLEEVNGNLIIKPIINHCQKSIDNDKNPLFKDKVNKVNILGRKQNKQIVTSKNPKIVPLCSQSSLKTRPPLPKLA